jgi:hypothetical protein
MPTLAAEREAARRRRALAAAPDTHALIAAVLNDTDTKQDLEAWLAQLFLLAPLPFSSVVVNASMLPPESLRFFYVDPNWLGALFDGAVSIGVGTPQQNGAVQMAIDELEQGALAQAGYGAGPACGFVLRSGVVAAYPRLVLTGYADAGGAQRIAPLRLDTLASNFIIGIYPQPLARLDIAEPPEGMQFGFERDDKPDDNNELIVNLRYLTGATPGKETGAKIKVAPYIGRAGDPTGTVVDIAGLQTALQNQLGGTVGPGDFAVQVVVAPETQQFPLHTPSAARAKR